MKTLKQAGLLLIMAGGLSLTACGGASDGGQDAAQAPAQASGQVVSQNQADQQGETPTKQVGMTGGAHTQAEQATGDEGKPMSLVEKGGKVYAQCAICHGPYGRSGIGKPLAGQSKDELVEKLKMYRAGRKIGVDASIMTLKARHLTDEDIDAVATYIAQRLVEK